MVFKRYINKNGKRLGPYYYRNVRLQNGTIKSVYLGQGISSPSSKILPLFLVILFLVVLLGISLFFSRQDLAMPTQPTEKSFEVDQQLIKVLLKEGESATKQVRVMNTGQQDVAFTISISGLGDLLTVANQEFSLKPGQTQVTDLKFITSAISRRTYYNPDVYVGKITIKADGQQAEIPVIIEIESKQVLFDMNLNMPATQRQISQGQVAVVDISLFNLQQISPANVRMEYSVKDLSGNVILTESKTVVLETKASFSKTFKVPDNLATGTYVFLSKALYGSSVGTSTYTLEVIKAEEEKAPEFNVSAICSTKDPLCSVSLLILLLIVFFIGAYAYFFIGAYIFKKISSDVLSEPTSKDITQQKPATKKWPYYIVIGIVLLLIVTTLHRRGILSILKQKTTLVWQSLPPVISDLIVVALVTLGLSMLAHYLIKSSPTIANAATRIKFRLREIKTRREEARRQKLAEKQREAQQQRKALHKIFAMLNPISTIKAKIAAIAESTRRMKQKLTPRLHRSIATNTGAPKLPSIPAPKLPKFKLPKAHFPKISLPEMPKIRLPDLGIKMAIKQWHRAAAEKRRKKEESRRQKKIEEQRLEKLQKQKQDEEERREKIRSEKEQAAKMLKQQRRREKLHKALSKLKPSSIAKTVASKYTSTLENLKEKIPKPTLPKFKVPRVKLPELQKPQLPKIHAPKFPKLNLPKIHLPKIRLPAIRIPKIKIPKMHAPSFRLPSIPKFKIPKIKLPEFKTKPVQKEIEKEVIKHIKLKDKSHLPSLPEMKKPEILKQIRQSTANILTHIKEFARKRRIKPAKPIEIKKHIFKPIQTEKPKLPRFHIREKISILIKKQKQLSHEISRKMHLLGEAMEQAAHKLKTKKPKFSEPAKSEPEKPQKEREPLMQSAYKILHGLGLIKTREERERLRQMKLHLRMEQEKDKQTVKLIRQRLKETRSFVEQQKYAEAEHNYGLLVEAFRTLPPKLQINLRPEIIKGYDKITAMKNKILKEKQ